MSTESGLPTSDVAFSPAVKAKQARRGSQHGLCPHGDHARLGAQPSRRSCRARSKRQGSMALFNVTPVEVLGNGSVTGVKFIRNKTAYGKIEAIPGSEFVEPCDMVLLGTGQGKQVELLEQISGVKLDQKGRILDHRGRIVVNEHYQTSNPQYFAAGDAVNGGVEV